VIKVGPRADDLRARNATVVRFEALFVGGPMESPRESEPEMPTAEDLSARIIAEAEARAQEIVAEAAVRAGRIREEAQREGYAAGQEEALAQLEIERVRLDAIGASLAQEREDFFQAVEADLVELSLDIARKVLKQELTQNTEAVLGVVQHALRRVKDKEARILVHPQDLQTVRDAQPLLDGISGGAFEVEVLGDGRVGPGGCVIETPSGNLDARLETQLESIEEQMNRLNEGGVHAS
jgi:flagellar biosynthesis/type III secretory pathway protein FliH